jgi:hypothetical protein
MLKGLFQAAGDTDDPEEAFYAWFERMFGHPVGDIARQGIAGALGVDLRGSLAIKGEPPTTIPEFLGAPGSVFVDLYQAGENILRGNVYKGVEKAMPRAIGTVMQASREYSQGVTTKYNAPVWFGNEQMQPSLYDTTLRILGFNPARLQRMKDIEWSEKKVTNEYRETRTEINSRIRAFFMQPPAERTLEAWVPILEDIMAYNQRVQTRQPGLQPVITPKSITTMLKTQMKPTKREVLRGYVQQQARGE